MTTDSAWFFLPTGAGIGYVAEAPKLEIEKTTVPVVAEPHTEPVQEVHVHHHHYHESKPKRDPNLSWYHDGTRYLTRAELIEACNQDADPDYDKGYGWNHSDGAM